MSEPSGATGPASPRSGAGCILPRAIEEPETHGGLVQRAALTLHLFLRPEHEYHTERHVICKVRNDPSRVRVHEGTQRVYRGV